MGHHRIRTESLELLKLRMQIFVLRRYVKQMNVALRMWVEIRRKAIHVYLTQLIKSAVRNGENSNSNNTGDCHLVVSNDKLCCFVGDLVSIACNSVNYSKLSHMESLFPRLNWKRKDLLYSMSVDETFDKWSDHISKSAINYYYYQLSSITSVTKHST